MKLKFNLNIQPATLVIIVLLLITSCSHRIMLTSSWTNREAKVKSSPVIMVLALGKPTSEIRKNIEDKIVARLKKNGYKALPATGLFKPGVKYDSAEMVSILRRNNIDMLLTNAVVSMSENKRFIPGSIQGTDIVVPSGGAAYADNPYNNIGFGYNNYYNYYNYYNGSNSYQVIEAQKVIGDTVTDVYIVIESNLYEVATPSLIWHGQSKSTTKDPTTGEINSFCKAVLDDIMKNRLLVK
jgi:hypothetical protein